MARKKTLTLDEQAEEIIKLAEKSGLQSNYFFVTTFERYKMQIKILSELKDRIEEDGALVTKEYVKGRGNLYTHPAISEYNRTTDSANKTVGTLIKIINGFKEDQKEADIDPLVAIINGGENEEISGKV
jgi:hypothetical protein